MRFQARVQVTCFALLGFIVLACFGPLWLAMLMPRKASSQSEITVETRSQPDDQRPEETQNSIVTFNADVIRLPVRSKRSQRYATGDNPHDKWIVVTSPKSHKTDISSLTQVPGWKVLVAGDMTSQTAEYCRSPTCTFLSLEKQFQMGFSIVHSLPENHVRKNLAYLYAIANGAKFIYDFDVESSLETIETFVLTGNMTGLMYSSSEFLFNPYRHFGQPTLWPRGFPVEYSDVTASYTYRLHTQWKTPYVQQGITNSGPDLDAFILLARKLNTGPIRLDQSMPPSILPEGTFSPINSKNTLFHEKAFWGLLLSVTTSSCTTDIWRGYWLQRLLWETEGYVGVFPPNANAVHKDLNYIKRMEEERSMYRLTEKLVNFLLGWTCPSDLTFFQCMLLLGSDMVVNQFWEKEDVELTYLWIEALIAIGYPEPRRVKQGAIEKPSIAQSEEFDVQTKREKTLGFGTVVAFGSPSRTIASCVQSAVKPESANTGKFVDAFASVCRQRSILSIPAPNFANVVAQGFKDLLLVVVVTEHTNTQYVDAALRLVFLNVAYCGDQTAHDQLRSKLAPSTEFVFVEVQRTGNESVGSLCAIKAMEMNFNASGHLVIRSDIILNLKQLHVLNRYRVWVDEAVFSILKAQDGARNAPPGDTSSGLTIGKGQATGRETVPAPAVNITALPMQSKYVGELFFIPRHLAMDVLYYFQKFLTQGVPVANASSTAIYTVLLCNDYETVPGGEFEKHESISLRDQMNFKTFLSRVDVTDNLRRSQLCDNHFFLW